MKKTIKFLFTVFIFIFLIMLYARYIGTLNFITKEYTIKDSNISNTFDGLKIVHFSDIHYNRAITIKKIKEVKDEINLINPDIVIFTGDLIDKDATINDTDYEKLTTIFSDIKSKYGKYAVLGNNDYKVDSDKIIKLYQDSNFTYLDNDYDIIYNKHNEKIFIGGINTMSHNQDDIDKTMLYFKDKTEDIYKIIIVHEPDITDKIIDNYNINLILAGHSLGGQIQLPYVGPIYTPKNARIYYEDHYNIKGTNLYISSGLGVSDINYRLFNPPSINFYRINKET